ncbi:MAG: c-type cytochrome [Vicinamibacterales bacterium]
MTIRGLIAIGAAAYVAVVVAGTNASGQTKTVWDGVYTAAQAERGNTLYQENCAACHGAEYTAGAGAPSLAGPEFQFSWNKKPAGELFDYMKSFMPPGQPGALTDQQYSEIVAALLRANKFPESPAAELPATKAELDTITILTTKP